MITIATWNINSVRLRIDQVERFLTQEQPDVLCLQEIKCAETLFPRDMFERLGYGHIAVHGQKGYHGVATVSRLPFTETGRHDWQANGEARHVGVDLTGHNIHLENVYIPAGGDIPDRDANAKFGQKLDFLDRMTAWSQSLDRSRWLRCRHWPVRTAGSIWDASTSLPRSETIPGGRTGPTGAKKTRAAGSITCGPRPIWRRARANTAWSRKPGGGISRRTTFR